MALNGIGTIAKGAAQTASGERRAYTQKYIGYKGIMPCKTGLNNVVSQAEFKVGDTVDNFRVA